MSTIKANTLLHSDGSTTTQPSIPALDQRMAKAWVNFNGTGTVAIKSSYGVSSITDQATGKYRTNLSITLPNTNYAVVFTAQYADAINFLTTQGMGALTTTSFDTIHRENGVNYDVFGQHAVIFSL